MNCLEDESKFGAILTLSERYLFMVIFGCKDHLLTQVIKFFLQVLGRHDKMVLGSAELSEVQTGLSGVLRGRWRELGK